MPALALAPTRDRAPAAARLHRARSVLALLVCTLVCGLTPDAVAAVPADPAGSPAPGDGQLFSLPADGAVVRLFVAPAVRWGPGHRGVDVTVTDGVVRAPADGTVTWAGHVVDRGVVTITHRRGLRTSLEPVSALHPVGTAVRRGEVVGHLESRRHGRCADACVHWGVRDGTEYVDPLGLLAPRTVRLLPWT